MQQPISNRINVQLIFLLLLVFVPAALWFAYDKNKEIHHKEAIRTASVFAKSVSSYRTFYSKTIVNKLSATKDVVITHDYHNKKNAIPLPATFAKDFGKFYSEKTGYKVNLYSDLPFPWNASQKLDDFEERALKHLQGNPKQPIWRFEDTKNGSVLRYAKADVLTESCVGCHNSYPGTPKNDWKVGDTRGVLSVTVPTSGSSLIFWIKQFGALLAIISLAALLLVITLRNLRKSLKESQETHTELEVSLSKSRSVFNSMNDVLIVINEKGIITETNNAVLSLLGYRSEELIGENIKIIVEPVHKAGHDQYLVNYHETGERKVLGVVRHVNAMHKDGSLVPIELSVNETETSEGRLYTGIIHDISERVKTEEALAKAHEQALESAKVKSQFLANMSHEIRTPMNGIIGMAQLMSDTKLTEEQTLLMNTIDVSTQSLLRIVNDVLDFSKMESGTYKIENNWFNLVELIEEVVSLSSEQAAEKGIALSFLTEGMVPLKVLGDRGRMRQIATNLIHNAIKFTDSGYVLVRLFSELETDSQLQLRIVVEDSGIGIPESEIPKLFDSFSQVDGTKTRRHDGSGLGLAISKGLAELMQGDISVTSTEGAGSAFTMHLSLPFEGEMVLPSLLHAEYVVFLAEDNHLGQLYMQQMQLVGMSAQGLFSDEAALWGGLKSNPKINFIVIDMDYLLRQGRTEDAVLEICNSILLKTDCKLALYAESKVVSRFGEQTTANTRMALVSTPVMPSQIMSALLVLDIVKKHEEEEALDLQNKNSENKKRESDKKETILVVEDNKINSLVVGKMLEKCGYQNVTMVENGSLAVDLLENTEFDLVFMDCQMPVMDGFEATRLIRVMEQEKETATAIVALTANALESDREACLEAGMNDHLPKPIDFDSLKMILKKWLG